jgi:hypothetical protein
MSQRTIPLQHTQLVILITVNEEERSIHVLVSEREHNNTDLQLTCRKISPSFVDRYKYTRCGQPAEVQGVRGSDGAQGVLLPLPFPSSLPLLL